MTKQVPIQDVDYTVALAVCEAIEVVLAPGSIVQQVTIAPNTPVYFELHTGYVEVIAL